MIAKTHITIKEDETYIYHNYYISELGAFFTFDKKQSVVINIDGCREVFSTLFNNKEMTHIGFVSKNVQLEKVDEFFNIIQEKLGYKWPVIFYQTQNPCIFVVKVPSFWRRDLFHRQLFTLFLRCAFYQFRDARSFQDALDNYILTKPKNVQTKLEIFLKRKKIKDNIFRSISNEIERCGGIVSFFKMYPISNIFAI